MEAGASSSLENENNQDLLQILANKFHKEENDKVSKSKKQKLKDRILKSEQNANLIAFDERTESTSILLLDMLLCNHSKESHNSSNTNQTIYEIKQPIIKPHVDYLSLI